MSALAKVMRRALPNLLGGLMLISGLAHAGTVTYVYTDPQGTPLAEADASGNITATFDYAPYGSQALGTPPSGPGYTGHVNDPESGLVYMQARYYDPAVGRFISRDPVGQKAGFNDYAYVGDNPINKIDPTGMFQCANKASCDAGMRLRSDFQKAQAHFKVGSAAFKSIAAGINALGTANDGGAIHVAAVRSQTVSIGWGGAPKGKTPNLNINFSELEKMPNSPQAEAEFAATGRHELQHVMDDMVNGDMPHKVKDEFWHEVRGIRAETPIWEGMGENDPSKTWTSGGGLNMKEVYKGAEASTVEYCKNGVCP